MKITLRSLFAIAAAVGVAAVGAANSAEAWVARDYSVTTAGSSNSLIVTYNNNPSNTTTAWWMGAGDYRPNIIQGRDSMYVSAIGGTGGGASVPLNAWTCVSSVFTGSTRANSTWPSFGSKAAAGATAYTPNSTNTQGVPTFPHINASRFEVECF